MVQTNFSAGNASTLSADLAAISTGGGDDAIDTAYTIAMTAGISLTGGVTLDAGSSLLLQGTYPFIADLNVTGTVETGLNFTGTVTLDNGVLLNPAIAANGGGTILAGIFTGNVLGSATDNGDTVANSGTIAGSGTYSAIDITSGLIQTGWGGPTTALVRAPAGGVAIQAAGLLQNGGTIIGSGVNVAGAFLGSGTIDNGQIGDTTALIAGTGSGAEINGAGVIVNDATIVGTAFGGAYVASGQIVNGQPGATNALIEGVNGYGVAFGTGTLTNLATIVGGGEYGAGLFSGGIVTNGGPSDTTALIQGAQEGVLAQGAATVTNYATIEATGPSLIQPIIGVFLYAGGTVDNATNAALISGSAWGVSVNNGAGLVTNLGTIESAGIGADLFTGGTLFNGSTTDTTALIQGGAATTNDGVRILGGPAGALVVNDGTIQGNVGVDFQSGVSQAAGTLINAGLVTGSSGVAAIFGTGAERLILAAGGAFLGNVIGGTGAGATTALELATATSGTLVSAATNSGTVIDSAGNFGFTFVQSVTVDQGASWTLLGSAAAIGNAGSLLLPAGTVGISQFINNGSLFVANGATATVNAVLISGTGDIVPATGGDLVLNAGTVASTETILFSGPGTIEIGESATVGATIQGFSTGDRIIVDTTVAATFSQTGSQVAVVANATTLDVLNFDNTADATTAIVTANALIDKVVCFLAGTMIATPSGECPVERLKIGDLVRTATGQTRPIAWIGTGRVLATRNRRTAATPVIVRKSAFAPNVPYADLRVTKGHAFWFDGVLIPAEFLVNHRTILWDDHAREITIYHIELDAHDILLANGAQAESYRDDGNRWLFQNGNSGWDQPEKPVCAPVLTGGETVDTVWRRLLDRSGARPGLPLTSDPDLHLTIDDRRLDPTIAGKTASVFKLDHVPQSVRLSSRSAAPQELGLSRDPRCLGVAIDRIELRQGRITRVLLAGSPALTNGFHPFEPEARLQWTDGDAELPASLFAGLTGPCELVVHCRGSTRYRDDGARGAAAA